MPAPQTLDIDPELPAESIAPGVIIHAGCRIHGAATTIGPDSVLGAEGPVTLENSQLGHRVEIKGGYVSGSVFLDQSGMGSCAHVRPGCLLEEEAGCAHAAGLKQTILLPFVTTGSLLNVCDFLMSGGTSRKNHSEIGSAYVHFNFTPHHDKATPSLAGDVPRGVMLDQPAIFLGGQGGVVGPARIGFGVIVPAGLIVRRDVLTADQLPAATAPAPPAVTGYEPGVYRRIQRIVANNLNYIGNLMALREWYRHARAPVMGGDPWRASCHAGAIRLLDDGIRERIKRLGELVGNLDASLRQGGSGLDPESRRQQESLRKQWPDWEKPLSAMDGEAAGCEDRDLFLGAWSKSAVPGDMPASLRKLDATAKQHGTRWLQAVLERVVAVGSL